MDGTEITTSTQSGHNQTSFALGLPGLSRADAARALDVSIRQVDRYITAGKLERCGDGAGVRVTIESVERMRGDRLVKSAPPATIILEAVHYEGLLLQVADKDRRLQDIQSKLLTWEGQVNALSCEVQQLRDLAAASEAEKQRIEVALAAERGNSWWRRLWGAPPKATQPPGVGGVTG